MRFFIFIILVPVVAGAVSAAFGFSYLNPETLGIALLINLPICMVSAAIYHSGSN